MAGRRPAARRGRVYGGGRPQRCGGLLLVVVSLFPFKFAVADGEAAPAPDAYEACQRMGDEFLEICQSFARFGIKDSDCQTSWRSRGAEVCAETGGFNCSLVGLELRELVWFGLRREAPQIDRHARAEYQNVAEREFVDYRCRAAIAPMLDTAMCQTEQAETCMRQCGNYRTCWCRVQHGAHASASDQCFGDTVIQGPMPGRSINYSCSEGPGTPRTCHHQTPEGSCGQYKYCPADLCLIRDIRCPNRTQCEQWGLCKPEEGFCRYEQRHDGYPCSDPHFYTLNDQCIAGQCVGTTDYCLMHDVVCAPLSPCASGGVCHGFSGRCTYDMAPEGQECDDGREYTVEDRCRQGVCVGREVDLCAEGGVVCEVPNSCFVPGVCDPLTGACTDAVPTTDPRACDDGDALTVNETCIDGICVGEAPGYARTAMFLTLTGSGECTDRDGRRMGRYSGDVYGGELDCELLCRNDVQCLAYGYAYPVCSIYGTVRTRAPSDGRAWFFQFGTTPPAVAVEKVTPAQVCAVVGQELECTPAIGQREFVCRRKGLEADTQDAHATLDIRVRDFFGFWVLLFFCVVVVLVFFACPVYRCCQILSRGPDEETVVEILRHAKDEREARRSHKPSDLRALANAVGTPADAFGLPADAGGTAGGILSNADVAALPADDPVAPPLQDEPQPPEAAPPAGDEAARALALSREDAEDAQDGAGAAAEPSAGEGDAAAPALG